MSTKKIMVATDGSELSAKAIETAIELTQALQGQLIGVSVCFAVGPDGQPDYKITDALEELQAMAESQKVNVVTQVLYAGEVSEGLLKAMKEEDVDIFVMASRGLGTIGAFLLGSETQKVLAGADRPVLVVR